MDTAQKKRFEELQAKGWQKLSGEERKEFQELRDASITKNVKAPTITALKKTSVEETKEEVKKEEKTKEGAYAFTTNVLHGSKLYKEGDLVESPLEEWITSGYVTQL